MFVFVLRFRCEARVKLAQRCKKRLQELMCLFVLMCIHKLKLWLRRTCNGMNEKVKNVESVTITARTLARCEVYRGYNTIKCVFCQQAAT